MKSTFFLSIAAFFASAHAATHKVTVGPGLSYSPNSLTANQGDIVQFTFGSGHNVVSGNFDSPCQPNGNIYSGEPNDGQVFSVTLNSSDPVWIYCSVPQHCERGMAMVINPESGRSIDDYKSAAASASGSSQPDSVIGGVFGAVKDSSTTSSAASSASSAVSSARSSASSAASSATSTRSSASASATSSSSASTYGVSGFVSLAAVLFAGLL